jgi:single-strand DNA-binding protein
LARSLNKVMLIGNLGADPEVRSTPNGGRVATISLATSRQWNNQAGERQEKTEWHRVVLWNTKGGGQLADIAERYLKKGDRVYVEGRIEYRTWEDREGNTRYSTEINAREMIMLSPRQGGGDVEMTAAAARSARPAAEAKSESYEEFPEALNENEEDDDLPF